MKVITKGRGRRVTPLLGFKFGRLTVIGRSDKEEFRPMGAVSPTGIADVTVVRHATSDRMHW